MPLRPQPYKRVCPKCGYSKIIARKSDCIEVNELKDECKAATCPKCKIPTEMKKLNPFDFFILIFKL